MKTLQQLYTEVMSSDEQKKAYLKAAKGGKVAEFLKAYGCEATAEEIKAFLQEKADQELPDEELDNAAGGTCNEQTKKEALVSTFTLGLGCAFDTYLSAGMMRAPSHLGQKNDSEGRICNVDQ